MLWVAPWENLEDLMLALLWRAWVTAGKAALECMESGLGCPSGGRVPA